ncbi:hypothetical protein JCM8547_008519 [Rhodosporidiobolus lusitaniae]
MLTWQSRTRLFICLRPRPASTMATVRSRSPPTPPDLDEPAAKRQRVQDEPATDQVDGEAMKEVPAKRKRGLPYHKGMHLAPMVRIGTLPVRLLSLEYGAELVWGPEIVDKAIIGSERVVNEKTGVISYMKGGRAIFECHPLEKPRLIFQLGSASPELAAQAVKVIEGDVAGVGLNCGCPKSFSLQGGMGAALLKDPERLCSILRALVASTDLPIDAKIRLLPMPKEGSSSGPTAPSESSQPLSTSTSSTPSPPASSSATPAPSSTASSALSPSSEPIVSTPLEPPSLLIPPTLHPSPSEPTLPLVSLILSTGISNLTVHCRTQEMRSSEPAMHERMREITRMGRERGVSVVCNGDGMWNGWEREGGNFGELCEKTGVTSIMVARAAEANTSCFAPSLSDPISTVLPHLLKLGIATSNPYNNTKYLLNAIDLYRSPSPPTKEKNREIKGRMNKAKTYEAMAEILGVQGEEVEELREAGRRGLEELVPVWAVRRKRIVEEEGEY